MGKNSVFNHFSLKINPLTKDIILFTKVNVASTILEQLPMSWEPQYIFIKHSLHQRDITDHIWELEEYYQMILYSC